MTSFGPSGLLSTCRPFRSLTALFWLWKAFLLVSIIACPGPGYDTSTTLLLVSNSDPGIQYYALSILLKLVRWDAIYFVHTAENGYVFEQEWAFGYGYTKILRLLTPAFYPLRGLNEVGRIALAGIALSHVTHYLSVLVLYGLSTKVFGQQTATQRLLSYLSAALHIISPGGAFLSAPNPESLFSLLNMSGFYVYLLSLHDDQARRRGSRDAKTLVAAALFAVATTVRSNGILSGLLFLHDALLQLWRLTSSGLSVSAIARMGITVLAGCITAMGVIVPQSIAYAAFCMRNDATRPWCWWSIPSIYIWVQNRYWNTGFLMYWTVSNIPLFLLATPMLVILLYSSFWVLRMSHFEPRRQSTSWPVQSKIAYLLLTRLATQQGLLALMALTSYHVQIINRLSSGYPMWYWYLASQLVDHVKGSKPCTRVRSLYSIAIQSMALYGIIQAVLFGSFLPPA